MNIPRYQGLSEFCPINMLVIFFYYKPIYAYHRKIKAGTIVKQKQEVSRFMISAQLVLYNTSRILSVHRNNIDRPVSNCIPVFYNTNGIIEFILLTRLLLHSLIYINIFMSLNIKCIITLSLLQSIPLNSYSIIYFTGSLFLNTVLQ